jgi:hypothetical protein
MFYSGALLLKRMISGLIQHGDSQADQTESFFHDKSREATSIFGAMTP